MAINNFNTGRDVTIIFTDGQGNPVALSNVTGFHSRQNTRKESSHGMDGVSRFQYIPQGWEGSITVDRFSRVFDDLTFQFEQIYLSGGNVPPCTIKEVIRESDGTQSEWRYTNVVFAMPDAGAKEQDKKIGMRLEWCASFRLRTQ
jgi:hypothetical protein